MFRLKLKKKELLNTEEESSPIRAITGIGNNMVQGIALLYQKPDLSAGLMNVWREDTDPDLFKLIRFIDDGESRIVWDISHYSDGTCDKVVKRIYIR